MSEENKQKLSAAMKKISDIWEEGKEEEIKRFFTEGLVRRGVEGLGIKGECINGDLMELKATYTPFEVDDQFTGSLLACSPTGQSYEEVFERFLYLLDITYNECKSLKKSASGNKADL